ncbi:hypothetical protein HHI36_011866 [Cryptolaemus montrouzieri]|uniref:Thiamin pyrophosphokinase thiamin-binding domain-containing protein n=1 Tax=Cryptolaemus montrouzieri TaxID=559131 RepID=A0ABD2NDH1_9CUCU
MDSAITFSPCKIRLLVDGGAESWVSWVESSSQEKCHLLPPHLVTGDFDSIKPETLEKFKQNKAIQIIHTPDQNYTDFTKALVEFNKYQLQNNIKIENIYVLTTIGERMDHAGTYIVNIPQSLRNSKEWCGLIPIGSPGIVTTSGLKWNLNNTKMEFGLLVSTSNTYDGSPEVKIETNSSILWTMGIKGFCDR